VLATAGGTGETPVVPTRQISIELLNAGIETAGGTGLPPVVPALAVATGSRPVVPVGPFLASSIAFSRLDLRTPVVAPVLPAGVLYSYIIALLFSNRWLAYSRYTTSEKIVSMLCLTHSLSLFAPRLHSLRDSS